MKKKIIYYGSAVLIGILIALYLCGDIINSALLPDYKLEDITANDKAKKYRFEVTINKDISKKDVERIGKQAIIALKQEKHEANTVMVFIFKDDKLYARVNFEKEEENLIAEKSGKYKDLYYTIDLENK